MSGEGIYGYQGGGSSYPSGLEQILTTITSIPDNNKELKQLLEQLITRNISYFQLAFPQYFNVDVKKDDTSYFKKIIERIKIGLYRRTVVNDLEDVAAQCLQDPDLKKSIIEEISKIVNSTQDNWNLDNEDKNVLHYYNCCLDYLKDTNLDKKTIKSIARRMKKDLTQALKKLEGLSPDDLQKTLQKEYSLAQKRKRILEFARLQIKKLKLDKIDPLFDKQTQDQIIQNALYDFQSQLPYLQYRIDYYKRQQELVKNTKAMRKEERNTGNFQEHRAKEEKSKEEYTNKDNRLYNFQ